MHAAGGRIFLQLWHVGRISDPTYLNGALPVAPSAIASEGHVSLLRPKKPFVTPRALEIAEIKETIEDYRRAAQNALTAGFDGVEIHGANGYLLDQFLQDISNHRLDEYGGSLINRARLMMEVTDAVVSVWGAGRVGMHLAPRCDSHSMGDSNPLSTFSYVAEQLSKRQIAFICARESQAEPRLGPTLRKLFNGVYVANEGLDLKMAEKLLEKNEADAVAFGKHFISNPTLPLKLKQSLPLTPFDVSTFYAPGANGYTSYT